jgi:hypothetical protein
LENPSISFSHTHDSTKFSAETLDELLQVISSSAVVTDMSQCTDLSILIRASSYRLVVIARPDNIYLSFRGPDRVLVLGKFETVTGYLRGHGGVEQPVGAALRPSLYIIATAHYCNS